jgi:hypothetical protein
MPFTQIFPDFPLKKYWSSIKNKSYFILQIQHAGLSLRYEHMNIYQYVQICKSIVGK